jgi:hypothetical protein
MSNRRKPALAGMYRRTYLRSPEWFARRDRWFAEQAARGIPLTCAGCGQPATKARLELHHLDYSGLVPGDNKILAREKHEDLTAMHAYCHELLHRLIDRDKVLSHNRTRRAATEIALIKLRRSLAHLPDSGTP